MNTKLINDTIYKHIECSKVEDEVLQTKIVNRLLFITQNALAYFAYPSINTKRYIHSLGTMHLSAHMFKNSILNANNETTNEFFKQLKLSIVDIIEQKNIDISLKQNDIFEDKALLEFSIPLKSDISKAIYHIVLQSVRLVGLLHDLGHFPFSHQVEYALENIYESLIEKDTKSLNDEERYFINFYEKTTHKNDEVLHEAIGSKLIKLLFEYELQVSKNSYLKLIYEIVKNIILEKKDEFFDYKLLHSYIDSTIDADRLDYVNRDMLASGYLSGAVDFIRITKQAILVKNENSFTVSFYDSEIIDIEHMLQMRFDLYKKIIFNSKIAATDTHLENVIYYLASNYFLDKYKKYNLTDSIAMLWKFLDIKELEQRLDIITQLDENWMITLFKKEYFNIKNKKDKTFYDMKYLKSFEEVLFGKRFFNPIWKNLNELYNILGFNEIQRYKFRESFGYVSSKRYRTLKKLLDSFCKKYEDEGIFLTYQIVSIKIGIEKDFSLFDGEKLIKIDEISTIRKRLKKSMLNTVPFYIYSNKQSLTTDMKMELQEILEKVFLK